MEPEPKRTSQIGLTSLALMLLVLATRVVFMYRGGMPEPDSVVMAAGMAKALAPGIGVGDATLYGRQLSPAMYAFTDIVYPLLFKSPAHMIAFLNWLGVLATSVLVWPLFVLLRTHMPRHAAVGTVLMVAFSPVVWEWGTYFHPLGPACLLLFLAMRCAMGVGRSPRGLGWCAGMLIASAAALAIRVDVLSVAPAILIWAVLSPTGRRRNVLLVLTSLVFSIGCYLLVLGAMPDSSDANAHGLGSYTTMLRNMYVHSFSLSGLTRSVTWAVLAMGAGAIIAALVGLVRYLTSLRARASRRWSSRHARVVAGLVWVLPALLFWLPQPTPIMRHYVLPSIGIAWLVGYLVLRHMSPRRSFAVAMTIIAVGLLVPEAAYRSYNAAHPDDVKWPHGSFFYQQQFQRERITRHASMATDVLTAATSDGNGAAVLVDWTGYAYVLYEMYTGPGDVEKVSQTRDNPNVSEERFSLERGTLRVVHGIRLTPESSPALAARRHLVDAQRDGLRVFVPGEAAAAGLSAGGLGFDVFTY